MVKPQTKDLVLRFLSWPVTYALVVFLPAGTLDYWEAWVSFAVFTLACVALSVWMAKHDPALLQRRLDVGPAAEKRAAQRVAMVLLLGAFMGVYVVSGLDRRFGWSDVPVWAVLAGDAAIALAFWWFYLVTKANTFAAATIRVEAEQKVIDTGPYGIVRHPMYASALVMMIGIPISLGSWWAIAAAVVGLPALHWRIVDEERMLLAELPGYEEYRKKVRWRMVPGVY